MERVGKKEKEKWAVLKFYKNQGFDINESDLSYPEENSHVDVIYNNEGSQIKFQVKGFPEAGEEVEGRLCGGENNIVSRQDENFTGEYRNIKGLGPSPSFGAGGSIYRIREEIEKIIIKRSGRNSRNQYSEDCKKEIIFLINNRHLSDVLIEWVLKNHKFNLSKISGFKEVYLVGFNKNIKIN